MARPTVIRDDDILQAARDVFGERGLAATTAEVAKRAGISEGSIFKHFKSKELLFRAALAPVLRRPALFSALAERVGRGDLRESLFELGIELVAHYRRLVPFIALMWSNPETAMKEREVSPGRSHPATDNIRLLAGYFEAEMRIGRLRRSDPEILTRFFGGALFQYAFAESLTPVNDELPLPAETFVRGAVDAMWKGIAPVRDAPPIIKRRTSRRARD